MKYYGIYKITNLLNGKMYIGKHVTSKLDDGYMGSSPWLRRSIKKHGVQNFRKEWLIFCEDEEELNYMERVFVDQTWVDRSDTYNLTLGGEGGWSYVNSRPISEETRRKYSIATTRRNTGRKLSEETKRKIGNANRNPSEETRLKNSKAHKGRKMPRHVRDILKERLKGCRWYNNGVINKRVKECPAGFVPGRLARTVESSRTRLEVEKKD